MGYPLAFLTPRNADRSPAHGPALSLRRFSRPRGTSLTRLPTATLIAIGLRDTIRRVELSKKKSRRPRPTSASCVETAASSPWRTGMLRWAIAFARNRENRKSTRLVRETDAGLIISGKLSMHTSPAYAEEVYVASAGGVMVDGKKATFLGRRERAGRHRGLPQDRSAPPQPFPRRRSAASSTNWTGRSGSMKVFGALGACLLHLRHILKRRIRLAGAAPALRAGPPRRSTVSARPGMRGRHGPQRESGHDGPDRRYGGRGPKMPSAFVAAELDAQVTEYGEYYPNALHLASGAPQPRVTQRLTEILPHPGGSSRSHGACR